MIQKTDLKDQSFGLVSFPLFSPPRGLQPDSLAELEGCRIKSDTEPTDFEVASPQDRQIFV